MGLHNLESEGLGDIVDQFSDQLGQAGAADWVQAMLARYGEQPHMPWSTQVEFLGHVLAGVKGLRFSLARRVATTKLERLNRLIELHRERRLAMFIELVDAPSFQDALTRWTVWKGVLFEVHVDGQPVVCWHPDKEFKPVDPVHLRRTQYSEVGKKKRRRAARAREQEDA